MKMDFSQRMETVRNDYDKIDLSRGAAVDIEVIYQGSKMHIPDGIPRLVALANHQGVWLWEVGWLEGLAEIWRKYISHLPTIIGANINYDLGYFATSLPEEERKNVFFVDHRPRKVWDVSAVDRTLFSGGYQKFSLQDVAERWLGIRIDKTIREQFSTPLFSFETTEEQKKYCALDAFYTYWVAVKQKKALQKFPSLLNVVEEIVLPALPMILMAQFYGVRVDVNGWVEYANDIQRKKNDIARTIYEKYGIQNPGSIQSVVEALRTLGARVENTQEETLEKIARGKNKRTAELAADILQFRNFAKQDEAFGKEFIVKNVRSGVIRSSFMIGARTGRIISSDPNLQQIPRGTYRRFFIPRDGCSFVIMDFSAQEPRIGGQISMDENFIRVINAGDIYIGVAKEALGWEIQKSDPRRQIVKAALLGIMYGMGSRSLAERLEIEEKEAREIINGIYNRFGKFREYQERASQLPVVYTIYGRPIWITSPGEERARMNAPIQGTGADILTLLLKESVPLLEESDARVILLVHDEVVFEVPTSIAEEFARRVEEVALRIAGRTHPNVKPKVEVYCGNSWAAKE